MFMQFNAKKNKKNRPKRERSSGQALISVVIFFLFISSTIVFGVLLPAAKSVRNATHFDLSRQSFFTTQAGVEDALYRVIKDMETQDTLVVTLGGYTATTTISDISGGKEVISEGEANRSFRRIKAVLSFGSGASFHYGLQVSTGGVNLLNNSFVSGNVFSNGSVTGENNNEIFGDVISSGSTGIIDGIDLSGDAYAHTITDSNVGGDAFYNVISNTGVGGSLNPGSADQETADLPIPDSLIEDLKADALTGGTISSPCPYTITSSQTIGPKKINCDLEIDTNGTVTLTGNIWVSGNIYIKGNSEVVVSPSLGGEVVAFIADKESNRLTSSKIDLSNNAVFSGTGEAGSYIMFISQNQSAENSGSEIAINAQNNVVGDILLYAGHGEIMVQNNLEIKEASAYKITAKNNAEIIYETGLVNLLFSSGPGGGYTVGKWKEVE
ncbi:MAG: hypothetical protein Q8P86_00290 [bacterium]|nr:hypothetical protein [bacterium]